MNSAALIDADDRLINVDILGALRRRKWIGLAVGILGAVATVAIVMSLPATYRSTATILIEEPDVPQDLVKSTVSTFANERLQIIQQRVMTSQNLNAIIDRFGLYGAPQQEASRSALVCTSPCSFCACSFRNCVVPAAFSWRLRLFSAR